MSSLTIMCARVEISLAAAGEHSAATSSLLRPSQQDTAAAGGICLLCRVECAVNGSTDDCLRTCLLGGLHGSCQPPAAARDPLQGGQKA